MGLSFLGQILEEHGEVAIVLLGRILPSLPDLRRHLGLELDVGIRDPMPGRRTVTSHSVRSHDTIMADFYARCIQLCGLRPDSANFFHPRTSHHVTQHAKRILLPGGLASTGGQGGWSPRAWGYAGVGIGKTTLSMTKGEPPRPSSQPALCFKAPGCYSFGSISRGFLRC